MLEVIHGRAVKRVGHRFFAVRIREESSADKLHSNQSAKNNWFRGMQRGKHARVIGQFKPYR